MLEKLQLVVQELLSLLPGTLFGYSGCMFPAGRPRSLVGVLRNLILRSSGQGQGLESRRKRTFFAKWVFLWLPFLA